MYTFGFITSPLQWLLILAIVLVIFGAKRLPEIGRGLGQSIREFKEEVSPEKTPGDKAKQVEATVINDDNQKS
ncbi:twin-arginine translocase TatA/TatE family subunit [Heliophilum fasciatum]|uniref:Sec-independent protein translocase protein TatA n=1 Tax=Heliophilum fasciatum TaxID=35700 RepID=A0A4V2SX02_9FIRM|nr:twin-arginine translocase TatA/TatE family subunit [Heliophilum fasciatum]MCW2278024.1 sec-independent protein translocase protein TatA [Heliophilum fasciatum]TCP64356.1 sec-independent protein translocase protein TatA [Heliophilum fasciatum]